MNSWQPLKDTLEKESPNSKEYKLEQANSTASFVADDFANSPHRKLHKAIHAKVTKHIHSLRKRPPHHKKMIAFGVAFCFTATLFTFWYYFSLPKIIASYKLNKEENKRLNLNPNIVQGFNDMQEAKRNSANSVDAIEAGQSVSY